MRYFLVAVAAVSLAGAAMAQDYTRYQGTWNGPFLFYFTQEDGGALGPPMVYPGTLEIERDGAVRGSVPDAACLMAGSSADYVSPVNATIDLDVRDCRDVRFNGRYTGKLLNNPALKYASIRLSSTRSLETGTAQISAIIRH
ncbi:hypothetical protein [Variovorax sp. Sphag1AA]|uniref:hypothetical protein n=1 Tax=Variovorax sp. Sphag1AA TaxID=2587027 RepID=UPI001610FCB9|nr:hypothetical protein [Variovorax sp. Sphag1AA]MBB3177849.1 hypothetical protein [Variovorax sp. Sphag1AA]